MRALAVVSTSSFFLLVPACGGGGGGATGAVTGLQAPQQVAIVESSSGTAAVRLPSRLRGVAGSDYETDATRFWVRDDSMEALDTVNMILRSLQQTCYWEQTNTGPYRALVELDDRDSGGERGNSGPEYEEWIVDSTRASNTAPQVVAFWIAGERGEGTDEASMLYGKLTVTEEPTDAEPLGQFTLFFKELAQSAQPTSSATNFQGYLRTVDRSDGQSELEFYMAHGDVDGVLMQGEHAILQCVHVIGNPANDTGRAWAERTFARNESGTTVVERGQFRLQFDADYVARRTVSNGNALAVLDRNDFETRVYRYGVYDAATETRVDRVAGFPVQDANGANGWAGYHGIWFPEHVALTDGQTLFRRSFGSNTTTPYTLVIAPGKLQQRTRSSITLGDVVGEEMDFWSPTGGGEQRVMFTGTDLVRTAQRSGGEWLAVEPPVSIAGSFTTGQWVNFWNQARGPVELTWPVALQTSTPAYVWTHTTMTADSPELAAGDLTLHGYFHLLQASLTANQANFQNGESAYLPDASAVNVGNQTYVFDRETLLLTLGGQPVTLADGVTIEQGPGLFGLACGPLFAEPLASFGDVPNRTTTYEWSIGPNPWNQLRVLRDGDGDFVAFDAPVRMPYVHDEAGSSYDGRTFFLEWDGTNLGGIPHEQLGETGMWYPLFNIPSGTAVTANGASYKVKQLEGEQFMVPVADPTAVYTARGFDLDSSPIAPPTSEPYRDPAIGAKPTVEAAPIYVGGVATTSDG